MTTFVLLYTSHKLCNLFIVDNKKIATVGARDAKCIEQSYKLYFKPNTLKIYRDRNSENEF